MKDRYVPALRRLERAEQTVQVKEALVDGYYVLGDVHDFNNAPMQAVKAYRKSIKYFPKPDFASGPWREMGNMYGQVGRYDMAIKNLKKAVRINPEDNYVVTDLDIAESDKAGDVKPLYSQSDSLYKSCELMAQDKPKAALDVLRNKRGLEKTCFNVYF